MALDFFFCELGHFDFIRLNYSYIKKRIIEKKRYFFS